MEWTTEVGCAYDAKFTISAQSGETRPVAIQFKDWAGNNLKVPVAVIAYLTNDAAGLVPTVLVDAELLIGSTGKLTALVTMLIYHLVSNATGHIDVTVTENGTDTYYLVLVLPNGKLVVSDALTFE